jgi:hypothetical protein
MSSMNAHKKRLANNLKRLSSVRNAMHPTHRTAVGNTMTTLLAILQSQEKLIADLRANCPPDGRPPRRTPPRFQARPPRPARRSSSTRKL